jgi:hypothetical protein
MWSRQLVVDEGRGQGAGGQLVFKDAIADAGITNAKHRAALAEYGPLTRLRGYFGSLLRRRLLIGRYVEVGHEYR